MNREGKALRYLGIFFGVLFALLPIAFIGLDFTDQGYHLVNQKFLFGEPNTISKNVYFWLSDFIGQQLVRISMVQTMTAWRLWGAVIWAVGGLLFFELLSRHSELLGKEKPKKTLLAICTVLGVWLSVKPFSNGILLGPDYYTVPIPFLIFFVFFVFEFERGQKPWAFVFACFCCILLPVLRWPLVVTGICVLLWWSIVAKKKWYPICALIVFCSALFLYHLNVIAQISPAAFNEIGHGRRIFRRYIIDILDLIQLGVGFGSVAGCLLFFLRYLRKGNLLNLLGSGALAFLCIFLFFGTDFFASFTDLKIVFFMLCGAIFLILRTPREERALWFLVIMVGFLYFAGSDTGLKKMGYLAFFILTPALYILLLEFKLQARALVIVAVGGLSWLHIYSSVYRDSLREIYLSPKIIEDSVLGTVMTTERNSEIISDFKRVLAQIPSSNEKVTVFPNAPLLVAYLTPGQVDLSSLWPELGWTQPVACFVGEAYHIFPKVNLASPEHSQIVGGLSYSPSGACSWALIFESQYFNLFKMVQQVDP